jgi:hypothetical protein
MCKIKKWDGEHFARYTKFTRKFMHEYNKENHGWGELPAGFFKHKQLLIPRRRRNLFSWIKMLVKHCFNFFKFD